MKSEDEIVKRVIQKLYDYVIEYNTFPFRWNFDWNDKLSTEENIGLCNVELQAIRQLQIAGLFKCYEEENRIRSEQLERFNDPLYNDDQKIIYGDWHKYRAWIREYDTFVWIEKINEDLLKNLCKTYKIGGKNIDDTGFKSVHLEIEDGVAIYLSVDNQKRVLKGNDISTSSTAFIVFSKAFEEGTVSISDFDPGYFSGFGNSFKQLFRTKNFKEGSVLRLFMKLSKEKLEVKTHINVDEAQLKFILKNTKEY